METVEHFATFHWSHSFSAGRPSSAAADVEKLLAARAKAGPAIAATPDSRISDHFQDKDKRAARSFIRTRPVASR